MMSSYSGLTNMSFVIISCVFLYRRGTITACITKNTVYTLTRIQVHHRFRTLQLSHTDVKMAKVQLKIWMSLNMRVQTANFFLKEPVYLFTRKSAISNPKKKADVHETKTKMSKGDFVMAEVHEFCMPVCLWGIVKEADGLLHHCTPEHSCQPPRGTPFSSLWAAGLRKNIRMFTCEPFPSVIWSCMFGKLCSRNPYTGPYTWQYISALSCPACFRVYLCTSWSIYQSFSVVALAR